MDDKWIENIDWNNVEITIDTDTIRKLRRMAFEFEEQQAAVKAFAEESPAEVFRLATGYDISEVADALNRIFLAFANSFIEAAEALSRILKEAGFAVCEGTEKSLPDLMEALRALCRDLEDNRVQQRYWKSYSCSQFRKQNIRAFQTIPCGYRPPLPKRNNRVMIRRIT